MVIEVVLVQHSEDEPDKIVFGPQAYASGSRENAVAQATADAVNDGVAIDGNTEPITRFFG